MTKPIKSRSEMKRLRHQHKYYCHACQLLRGATFDKDKCVTMTLGICSGCKQKKPLVPDSDYDWPKLGLKAEFD